MREIESKLYLRCKPTHRIRLKSHPHTYRRNILKDLNHEHIVRYHDRYVDRDAGILYILMEYCGGGDLSTIIKQATKQNRPLPEDTIWNYFLQILLALHHCHHPNAHAGTGASANLILAFDADVNSRRTQILHRDLKPDNGASEFQWYFL